MRRCLVLVPAVALVAGCTPSVGNLFGDNGTSDARSAGPGGDARVTITATNGNPCSANWNGEAVTSEQITQRSVVLLDRAITAAGGIQNVTEETLPTPNVEAPAELSFACADTILFSLQRAGMANVRLRPASGPAAVLADFPLDTNAPPPPMPPMVLGIGAGGQITWNNDPIDAAGLAAELTRIGGSTAAPDPAEGSAPPGGFELRPTREATFGQVYELLRTTSRYHLRPFLYLPSSGAGSAPPVAPPPPPDPLANRR